MIELIMVMTIIGVLSAYVAMKWPTGVALATAAQQLAQDLRYAQNLAMNRGNGYQLAWVDSDTYRILSPANAELSRGDLDGATLVGNIASFSVTFNGVGKPTASVTLTLTDGSTNKMVTVSAETGMVQ